MEFTTPAEPNDAQALFLDAPWELLANERGFLAAQEALQYNPIRRLGDAGEPEKPSPYHLALTFMAASPAGQAPLSYEAEEVAIMDSTGRMVDCILSHVSIWKPPMVRMTPRMPGV